MAQVSSNPVSTVINEPEIRGGDTSLALPRGTTIAVVVIVVLVATGLFIGVVYISRKFYSR